jgi:succinate dehydrogenase hydrophobic anchor subunit
MNINTWLILALDLTIWYAILFTIPKYRYHNHKIEYKHGWLGKWKPIEDYLKKHGYPEGDK